ncbi:MAG TPA: hypothetical protein PKA90_07490 [Ignavibacteria bacterium]|nr:hypothetical protein [Ignavibacteria bacterium]HMR40259.1 hypothetical protein [Ignavibacteria bacterium]
MKTRIIKRIPQLFIIMILTGIVILSGCSNEDPVTTQADNLEFNYTGSRDTAESSGALILDTVKILLKDIKLNVSNNNNDSMNFRTGPYVLYLYLNSPVNFMDAGFLPEGTYDRVKFMIHKLNDNESVPDPEFADAGGRYSVIVKGSYLGIPFIYKSAKSAHQILAFPNSLFLSPSGKTNITLKVLPYIWFIKNGVYMDPADESNRNDIDNNIKNNINNNFRIFIDNDNNGIPD